MNIDLLMEHTSKIESLQKRRRYELNAKPWRPTSTPATALGYRCIRRITYSRVCPELALPIGEELASIFEEGNLHQTDVRRELAAIGYEIVEAEVPFRDNRLQISGRIDGKIAIPDPEGSHGETRVPVEIKSTSGSAPKSGESWRRETGLLGRYYAQLQVYLYLTSEPFGIGLFKSKITGIWSLVPVAFDYDYAEMLLQRAQAVRDAVKAVEENGMDVLPEMIPDRSECKACPFVDTVCHPADAECDPVKISKDKDLIKQLTKREELAALAGEFKKIDFDIKARFRMTHGNEFVVGNFFVEKRPHGRGTRVRIKNMKG